MYYFLFSPPLLIIFTSFTNTLYYSIKYYK